MGEGGGGRLERAWVTFLVPILELTEIVHDLPSDPSRG